MIEGKCDNPTVSVIIPTYGRPDYLKRAVESVLNQTYRKIEVIVIDDNNPDTPERIATMKTMEAYSKTENVIYLKHEFNKNGSAARNTGINASSGKYICFLDDDDEMLPERIEKFVLKMEALDESWGACYSDFIKLKPNGEKNYCGEKRTGDLYEEALMRALYFCPGSNLFVRAEAVKAIGGFDEDFRRNQDLEFLARLLEHNKLAFVDAQTLTIHYEDKTAGKAKYENLVALDDFYLNKFRSRIDRLSPKSQKKVYQYIALARLKYSVQMGKTKDGLANCRKNYVTLPLLVRYIFYMGYRFITKKSVGFKI